MCNKQHIVASRRKVGIFDLLWLRVWHCYLIICGLATVFPVNANKLASDVLVPMFRNVVHIRPEIVNSVITIFVVKHYALRNVGVEL